MASVSIRDLDDGVRDRIRLRAAEHGRSMEAEMRAILTEAVAAPADDLGLFGTLIARVAEIGGVDLDIRERDQTPPPIIDFS